jgi:hypothetical protein
VFKPTKLFRKRRSKKVLLLPPILALAAGAALLATAAHASTRTADPRLAALRSATRSFHDISKAERAGYALLTDAQGIACIEMPGMGAMGVHWANSNLVADPAERLRHPEAMVYARQPDGTLQLAAVEYVVLKKAWLANHAKAPRLFGHRFNFTDAPNRFGLPPFYSLHVWAWKQNPAGTFAMWNPRVSCRPQA